MQTQDRSKQDSSKRIAGFASGKDFWTVEEFASVIHSKPQTIYNWYACGKKDLPPRLKIGGKVLFPVEETTQWINNHIG